MRRISVALVPMLLATTTVTADAAVPSHRSVKDRAGDAVRYCTTSSGSGCDDTGWPEWDLRRVSYSSETTGLQISWKVRGMEPVSEAGSWEQTLGAGLFWRGDLRAIVEIKPQENKRPVVLWETDGSVPETSDRVRFKRGMNARKDLAWVLVPWRKVRCPGRLRLRAVVTKRDYVVHRRVIDERLGPAISARRCR